MKVRERLWSCFRLKETKEIWEVNVIHNPGLNPGKEKDILEQLGIFEWSLCNRLVGSVVSILSDFGWYYYYYAGECLCVKYTVETYSHS